MSGGGFPVLRASATPSARLSLLGSVGCGLLVFGFAVLVVGYTVPAHLPAARQTAALAPASTTVKLIVSPLAAPPPLNVSNFTANVTATDVRVPVNFTVTPRGGSMNPANWNYTWTLPTGCVSSWAATDICSPSSAGTAPVHVLVRDTVTHQTATTPTINLAVSPLPSVTLTANAHNITLGTTIVLNATGTGGIKPYTYHYAQLPIGCKGNATAVLLSCKPNATGVYSPIVTVTDSVGGTSAKATTAINVTAASTVSSQSGPGATGWAVIAAIVIVGAIIVVALLLTARREERVSFMATPRQPPTGGIPPGPGELTPPETGAPPGPPIGGPPT